MLTLLRHHEIHASYIWLLQRHAQSGVHWLPIFICTSTAASLISVTVIASHTFSISLPWAGSVVHFLGYMTISRVSIDKSLQVLNQANTHIIQVFLVGLCMYTRKMCKCIFVDSVCYNLEWAEQLNKRRKFMNFNPSCVFMYYTFLYNISRIFKICEIYF